MDEQIQNPKSFVKGGKPGPGRPKGSIAQATLEIRAFCRSVVDSPEYRQKLYDDACARRLSPAVEMMLWDRAYGSVPKEIRVDDVSNIDTDSLQRRLRELVAALPVVDMLPGDDAAETETDRAGE
jgi:hypothetical protein